MSTPDPRIAFLTDLAEVLERHKASLSAGDRSNEYISFGSDIRITVEMPYPTREIDLSGYLDAEMARYKAEDITKEAAK